MMRTRSSRIEGTGRSTRSSINLSSGQHALTMRVAPQALPAVGDDIRVAIHPGLHFFRRERRRL